MSLSPTTSVSNSEAPNKKRRTSGPNNGSANGVQQQDAQSPSTQDKAHPPVQIPKRGARACTACRKGKNRCEGESPCRRCQLSGTLCVFEKPEKKNVSLMSTGSVERISRLEGQYLVMQSQMIGMQSSLDRILAAIQSNTTQNANFPSQSQIPSGISAAHSAHYGSPDESFKGLEYYSSSSTNEAARQSGSRKFPPLPGFAAPPHKYATYGIVPSTTPSSEDESEDTLPRSTMNAPIEALQGLANAAAEAAAASSTKTPRLNKRRRVEPIPRNAFPSVLEKGLVTDQEAKELYHIFFSGCHLFIPLFDPTYDTFDGLKERTPFCFDAILAVASKIRSGNGPLTSPPTPTFYKCLEEAQGIARSTLFGPIVRKEAVQAMLLLSAWSTNGWLPSGHAMRMALDLGLHRALEKMVDGGAKRRTDEEERHLVVSARIWLCLYWFDHQMSLGTGRPIVLRDENSIKHCRLLLKHPMASPTDVRLVSLIELIAQKTQIYETLSPLDAQVNHSTLAFIRRAYIALEKWWSDCDQLHASQDMDDESLLRKILAGELYYAKLWLVCVALRGAPWDKMPFEQRELAFQAKEAASSCLSTFLNSPAYRAALRYAVHDSLVTAAFSGLFLLKMANLFPAEVDLAAITSQVEQLANLLSDVAAERYALTLRLMLANLRRKVGLASHSHTPQPVSGQPATDTDGTLVVPPNFVGNAATTLPPLTTEDLGFVWPAEGGIFSPSSIPVWLQEQSLGDLGLPINGSDGIFLNVSGPNSWNSDFGSMPQAW
ncbi:hypothetical protein JB92DRAFT_2688064 [Gautieria morchelliformis]|nr:hypothetical protein JB92DRAFT_2688064 [Gautieria morchelliformis]